MALFEKKKRVIEVGGQKIELQPKPTKNPFSSIIKAPKKPAAPSAGAPPGTPPGQQPGAQQKGTPKPFAMPRPNLFQKQPGSTAGPAMPKMNIPQLTGVQKPDQAQQKKPSPFANLMKPTKERPKPDEGKFEMKVKAGIPEQHIEQINRPTITRPESAYQVPGVPGAEEKKSPLRQYLEKQGSKQKGLDAAVQNMRIAPTTYDFVLRMFLAAAMLAAVLAVTVFLLLTAVGLSSIEGVLIGAMIGFAVYNAAFRAFLQYPTAKGQVTGKSIERDILFAARDLIISLRSGMPLFNAITLISHGYGDASSEFEKVVDKVQLGAPLEEAIDETVAQSKSPSFRRIMLQASVSIKAGADVVTALQSVIDQLSQERIIELRAYGQKLNAIAMFYMLFGVILPSMGIAVITILTTFIALFTIDTSVLAAVIVGITFLQIVFLKLITGSRPVFAL